MLFRDFVNTFFACFTKFLIASAVCLAPHCKFLLLFEDLFLSY